MGNLLSVSRAIAKVGGDPELISDPTSVAKADAVVVPGVGAFGACIRSLRGSGLDCAIRSFAGSGRPLFGVCLGLQVLFEGSEEDPDDGLGLLPGRIRRLVADTVKVPHMGWNEVEWTSDHAYTRGVPSGTRFYFVHSYALGPGPDTVGTTTHGAEMSAAVARGNIFATQFHPEKSGEPGLAIYEAFVREASA